MLRISKKDTFRTFPGLLVCIPSFVGLRLLHIYSLKSGAKLHVSLSFVPSSLCI